jgi:hypothetical protein
MKKFDTNFFSFFFIIHILHISNSFLNISMTLLQIYDNIMNIYLEDGTILYNNSQNYIDTLFAPIPYEIGCSI